MSKRVRMLTNACGPTMNLEAGKVYDLPDDLASRLLKTEDIFAEETVNVGGKDVTHKRKLCTAGPYARLDPTAKKVTPNWKRKPDAERDDE